MVELRDENGLPQEFSRSIRSEVSFRVLSEVSIQGHGRQDKETTARDDQRSVREDGNRDCAREDHGRSRARVFVGAAEVFSCGGHETDQREQFGEAFSGDSGAQEAILGTALLVTRIFREHSWSRGRNDQEIHQRTKQSRQSAETLELIGSHRQSRWSFTSDILKRRKRRQ